MDTETRSCVLFLHALIILQYCLSSCSARKIFAEQHWNFVGDQYKELQSSKDINQLPRQAKEAKIYSQKLLSESDQPTGLGNHVEGNRKDLAVNIFVRIGDLQVGKKIPLYFPVKEPSTKPPLLTREEADSIPFSSSKISYLLDFFSFSKDSPQAKAMQVTLKHCEFEAMDGETKFCATSLESMLDSALGIFGTNTPFEVLTTNHLTKPSTLLQNYTIADEPQVISTPKMIACHSLPYPYAVFYCHGQKSDNKLFKMCLLGDDGGKIDAAAVCHMDSSKWDPNNVAFKVLKTGPGKSPVCHFFPEDNLIWVASSSHAP